MMTLPNWHWNEMQQVGTDYNDTAEVEAYDSRMEEFRDVKQENLKVLETLALPPGAAVLDIGCGTGRFARAAAAEGLLVSAVDVSAVMLEYVRQKFKEQNLKIGDLQHAGFLTMDFPAEKFDAAFSNAVLHHLPDAWKLSALRNVARILKPGGQLLLGDVVFSLEPDESPEDCFARFSASFPNMEKEAARHAAREFSTYDWIMEGLLRRAGFDIVSVSRASKSFVLYHCRK
jgi:putative AdoMet-dependent methyltransferase